MNLSMHHLITIEQFCELAHISPSRFYLERSAGRINVIQIGIRSVRIRMSEYDAWLKRLKTLNSAGASRKGGAK